MTAEIVDFLQYRQRKARSEKKSRRAKTGGGRTRAAQKKTRPREAEAPLPEEALEGEDGSRDGEPA